MLCSNCDCMLRIDLQDPGNIPGFYEKKGLHHQSLNALLLAIRHGCYVCTYQGQYLTEYGDVSLNVEDAELLTFKYRMTASKYGIQNFVIKSHAAGRDGPYLCWKLGKIDYSSSHLDKDCRDLHLDNNTGSIATLETIRRWSKICDFSHNHCHEGRQEGWHPKRLLEIKGNAERVESIRLVTLPVTVKAPYTALSHSWGGISTITLTNESWPSLSAGFSCEGLPKTFHDAVKLTSSLGLSYIWIDSLCILQDEESDWQREASQMHLVYGNAEFTLAATAAINSHGGLFFERNPTLVQPCVVHTSLNGRNYPASVLVRPGTFEDIDSAPLNKRAWVRQERLLSRRVIQFAKDQVYWECRTGIVSEGHPQGPPFAAGSSIYDPPPKFWNRHLNRTSKSEPSANLIWAQELRGFSSCGLTIDTDKMPCIAGLARILSENTGERYVAGMWEKNLIWYLPWRNESAIGHLRRIKAQAPSWSWISWFGRIVYGPPLHPQLPGMHQKVIEEKAQLIEVVIKHATDDPYGHVERGVLRLNAVAIPVRLTRSSSSVAYADALGLSHDSGNRKQRLYVDDHTADLPDFATFLPMYLEVGWSPGVPTQTVCGIVVIPTTDSQHHRRIGMMTFYYGELTGSVLRRIQEYQKYWQEIFIV